jgi:hypothetical protein
MKLLSNINLKNLNLKNLKLEIKKIDFKKVFNKHNAKILTNIVLLLLFLWSILYVIPEFFVFLFNTFLGKLILVLTTIIVSIYNYKHGIILASILIIIYRSYVLSNYTLQPITNDKTNSDKTNSDKTNGKEGFTWSQEQIDEFIRVQDSDSPQIVYNTTQLQKYASPSEVDDFLKNGMWPWSDTTQEKYVEYLEKNPYVRVYKTNGLDSARKVYNESAILYILKGQEEQQQEQEKKEQEQQEKEEQQNKLPSGWGIFGYNSGLL